MLKRKQCTFSYCNLAGLTIRLAKSHHYSNYTIMNIDDSIFSHWQ